MAVTSAMVGMVTKGAYNPGDSDATFVQIKTWAQKQLNKDNPGFDTDTYDRCHALLIAHMYFTGDPAFGMRSFSSGDFSGSLNPGETIWLLQYYQAIKMFQTSLSTKDDVTRSDAVMDDMKFDQNDVPSYFSEDT